MDITALLVSVGPFAIAIVALIVFVENGLLFPFLPGDSLVFALALVASGIGTSWVLLAAISAAAAIAGGEVGYLIGRRWGRGMFREDSRVLKLRYLRESEQFFAKWGRGALVLGRFVPIVRTFMAPAAGASDMPHASFSVWNAVSGVLWAGLLSVAGALLGRIPWVASNVEWIAIGIVVVTVLPVVIGALLRRRRTVRDHD